MHRTMVILLLLLVGDAVVTAQENGTLGEVAEGELVQVPFDVRIRLDGDLTDWAEIPFTTVATESERLGFAVAADHSNLYVAATVAGDNLTISETDTLEVYVNFTEDLTLETYTDGVFQIILPAANLDVEREVTNNMVEMHIIEGVSQVWELPPPAIIRGRNSDRIDPIVASFETQDGWGIEGAIPLPADFAPADGERIGFDVIADMPDVLERPLVWSSPASESPSAFGVAEFVAINEK